MACIAQGGVDLRRVPARDMQAMPVVKDGVMYGVQFA
jgi:hypothetical protein